MRPIKLRTLIQMMDDEERNALDSVPPVSKSSTLFAYPIYMKHLDICALIRAARYWAKQWWPLTDQVSAKRPPLLVVPQIVKSILRLFIRYSANVLTLTLDDYRCNDFVEEEILMLFDKDLRKLISTTRDVRVRFSTAKHKVLRYLSESCGHLERIDVKIASESACTDLPTLTDLISSQQNLTHFVFRGRLLRDYKSGSDQNQLHVTKKLRESMKALLRHSKTIRSLEFYNIALVDVPALSSFTNLEELKFQECAGFRDAFVNDLLKNDFKKLRNVEIRFCAGGNKLDAWVEHFKDRDHRAMLS
ncbi:11127_t:CDS:2 [Paraglomus brasilianum]|uniref:11127_t:CDS:1 n=1 Tax=Paraglomus brasilianum TaxID=144538 RepID=A0A9N9A466_9GLOM|nr:11127_t:CDS:2 [Paraglomus brasilianum]